MSNNLFSWKKFIIVLLLGVGIWILIPNIIGLKQSFELLNKIKYWALLLAILSESFFYIGSTILTQTVLKMTKDTLRFRDILKISIMDSFSLQFLPFGTLGEATVNYYFYRLKKIRTSHILMMFVSRTITIWLIFAIIYLIGVAFSPTNSQMDTTKMLIIWLIYLVAFIFLFYLIYLYYKKELLTKRVLRFVNLLNIVIKIFYAKKIPSEKIPPYVDKIYEATDIMSKNRKLQLSAIFGGLLYWIGDIACLYFAFLGFGFQPNIAIVIFAYCITKIISILSFIPGGIGITEASLSLIFIGFGVPPSISLAAVLVFRLISFWLPIPIGLASFLSLQKNYYKINLQETNI
ncbi:MAG: hypothetical protein US94_C0003G0017 [Berkelbacteria bacterium GW2011_GWB1_38_5]|uniref:Lysylphosphatidylglycerol synthetase/UPF0104 n=2 Tax=Candidatus Berkelbacteria TaxID=1618330 RepID=A0A0G0LGN8_9BACT|nr:MAG: hypothetical protein US94_C0003G0017 [Berkelbacteria bacterium GW2011_GWB1_38_5]KKQ91063.1 MAG: hypothetical protein UT15_C0001G0043 [Berkelbacteria bacterium GW2011_GWA1_39_10]